jgi:hypothetical protein
VTLFGSPSEPVLAGPAPKGLGRAMAGGGDKVNRRANDFYPTPADVTRALLRVEHHCIANSGDGTVWEPCGRGGAIMRELERDGFKTIGTDIVADPPNNVTQADLLTVKRAPAKVAVTNPPFALAAPMIVHLLERLKVDYLALLLKSQFWHADERTGLFRAHRPARIYALTWRPDFTHGGAPTMECQWVVWQRGWASGTHYHVLPRGAPQERML